MFMIILMAVMTLVNPFVEVTVGRCTDNLGNGKEYNGEPYYNYIKYDASEIHENDIVVTGFVLDSYGEAEERFDVVVFKDAK